MKVNACLATLVLVVSTFNVQAATIDQEQPNRTTLAWINSSGNIWSQSFQQAGTDLSGAGVYVAAGSFDDSHVWFQVWDQAPSDNNSPGVGATLLVDSALVQPTSEGWLDIFWSPVAISPNTDYWLWVQSDSVQNFTVGVNGVDEYAGGAAYRGGVIEPTWDLQFRTFTDSPAAVPEINGSQLGIGLTLLLSLVLLCREREGFQA